MQVCEKSRSRIHEINYFESEEKKKKYVEKLYQPNKLIKYGRHIITTHIKMLVKFYQFLVTEESRTQRTKKWSGRGKGNDEKKQSVFMFFFSLCSCEDWVESAFSFSLVPEIRSIEPRYRWSQHEFPARKDPWPLLPGSSRMFRYTQTTS